MNPLRILAEQPGVARLGSTLLHFLWQGVAIAGAYAAARWRAEKCAPNTRYLLACTALAVMAVSPLVTWCLLAAPAADVFAVPSAPPHSASLAAAVPSVPAAVPGGIYGTPAPLMPWVVAAWLAGATVLWVRLIGGWVIAARLRSRLVCPAPAVWQQTLDRLKARMGVSGTVRLLVSPLVQAPAVVGWLRPVVLAPVGALAGLPAEQVEALLLHELAHIRRYDALINLLQSAVEALLFYHPAVWWVSGHMRAERELCCDDAAVSASGDAVVYARALASLGLIRPAMAMAANGGSLAERIGRLLGQPRSAPRPSSTALAAAAVLPVIAALAVFAQPALRPKFEVVSIKPAGDFGSNMWLNQRPDGFTGTVSLELLIQRAYGVRQFQIAGGEDWMKSERYVLDAKGEGKSGHDQLSLMVQSLLEDRFALKIHRETRELPVYNLVIAKGGPKLPSPHPGACVEAGDPPVELTGGRMTPPGNAPTPLVKCGGLGITLETGGTRMYGGKIDMPELVRVLSTSVGRKIIDKTGYTALFDVQLRFVPDGDTPLLPPPPPGAEPPDLLNPSIFNALPTQLGLRLESAKGPVDVIVIDHADRPTAN